MSCLESDAFTYGYRGFWIGIVLMILCYWQMGAWVDERETEPFTMGTECHYHGPDGWWGIEKTHLGIEPLRECP